ncbi:MAG: ribonuclease III [Deltaproteobacteria bacterium]|nr:ribonuclease III [Deltaproteobacteria bacterium]
MPDEPLPPALSRVIERAADPGRARELMIEALTHRTWVNEHPSGGRSHNQRLELLGDAVLELIVTHELFEQLPGADEGLLSRARATAVNEAALAQAARAIDLGPALLLGRGEAASGGRERARTLADAFEAVVAATYLAGGVALAKELLDHALGEVVAGAVRGAASDARGTAGLAGVDARVKDAKSVLQEIVQRDGGPPPVYVHEEPSGPVHDRLFHARVMAGGRELGRGEGRSRREAEMRAAGDALDDLRFERDGEGSGDAST